MFLIEIVHNLMKRFTLFLAASLHLNYQERHMGNAAAASCSRRLHQSSDSLSLPDLSPISPNSCCVDAELTPVLPHIPGSRLQRCSTSRWNTRGGGRTSPWEMRHTELGPSQDHLKSCGVEIWLSIHLLLLSSSSRRPKDTLPQDPKLSPHDCKLASKRAILIKVLWLSVLLSSRRQRNTKGGVHFALNEEELDLFCGKCVELWATEH